MDRLPPPLLLDILSRLGDAAEVACCRVASKIFNSISHELNSIRLQCSFERYIKSRRPLTRSSITPFKTIFRRLISELTVVESVSIGVEKPPYSWGYEDLEDEDDNLYLTDVDFVNLWLPQVSDALKLLSISDFWVQSCWRRSHVLSVISAHCNNLVELEIKNAWLSVDGLNAMPKLLSLTLEYIRLDDEDLNMVNQCFPSLQILNLIGVGGLKEPKVNLLNLQACQWTLSNAVDTIAIIAPNLVKLQLKCVKPKALTIKSPSLSDLRLSLEEAGNFQVEEFSRLMDLYLESHDLQKLLCTFPFGKTIKNLKLGLTSRKPGQIGLTRFSVGRVGVPKFGFKSLFTVFPNVSSLTLTHWVWSALEMHTIHKGFDSMAQNQGLKEITAYLQIHDFDTTLSLLFSILEVCNNLSDMRIFIHHDVVLHVTDTLVARCMARWPCVRWKWGIWKEGELDAWIHTVM